MADSPQQLLRHLFDAAVEAADPARCVPPALAIEPPKGRTIVIGAGKAAAAMARAVENHWNHPLTGLVVTRYGYAVPCRSIEVIEAAHPVPDSTGREAAGRILDVANAAGADDLVLCLISGGASALLNLPAPGLSFEDKQAVNRALLASGATIIEMNCVRKHISAIKGGRLAAAAAPARVVSLLISDVPGDDPAVIGSGPTVPDPTTYADALAVLDKYGIEGPRSVREHLERAEDETPKPGDPRLAHARAEIIVKPADALAAAAAAAKSDMFDTVLLGDAIEGEARDVGAAHAQMALGADRPRLLLSGGETTVTIAGSGRGGPNTEYLLGMALALDGRPGVHAIACDTDGVDGSEDNAGAFIGPTTLARARQKGLDPAAMLADNDGYGFFSALGDLVVTGPTMTNVNDFRGVFVTEDAFTGAQARSGG